MYRLKSYTGVAMLPTALTKIRLSPPRTKKEEHVLFHNRHLVMLLLHSSDR